MKNIVKPGEMIGFRLPVDTPQEVIDFLNDLRLPDANQTYTTTFANECSTIFVRAIQEKLDARMVKVTSPEPLTLKQEKWVEDPYTRMFLGKFLFQFINEPSSFENMKK